MSDSSDSEDEKPKKKASSKVSSRKQSKKDDGVETEIFVGNLPWSADEQALTSRFSAYGLVNAVKLLYNEEGQSRGIAFIKMGSS